MIRKPALAALVFLAAPTFAHEVQLSDQAKTDLRERAEIYRREGRHDRTMELAREAEQKAAKERVTKTRIGRERAPR